MTITLTREEAQQVLDALEKHIFEYETTELLRARLSAPEPEPVAWLSVDSIGERYLCFSRPKDNDSVQPLYTTPPQREWQGLTAKDLSEIPPSCYEGAIWADARLKEKNR
jgi:hypothetical protein